MRIQPIAVWVLAVAIAMSCRTEAQSKRTVDLDLFAAVTKLPPDAKTVDLWLPVPSDGEGQVVTNVQIKSGDNGAIATENVFGNRIYHRRFSGPFASATEPSAELTFRVSRTEYIVAAAKKIGPPQQGTTPPELSAYLKPTSMIPITGRVTDMGAPLKLTKDDSIRSARKVYDYLLDRMEYNWLAKGAGRGDVLWACDSRTGDCTDYHSLFIALCRSNGIPADHEFGPPLAKDKKSGRATFFHCWARFWAPGVGWVPIDASEADKHPELREYNFGTLSANFVRMSHGRDVVLEPPQKSGPLNMFHGPYAEVDGKPYAGIRWGIDYKDVAEPPSK